MKHYAMVFWILGVVILVGLSWFYQGETTTFYGVAEASETAVSIESPVEILSIPVVPGVKVRQGDTLVRLRRPELALRISELARELEGVAGKASETTSTIDRQVADIRAGLESRRNQLQFEIQNLTNERNRNRELASRLKSLPRIPAQSDTADAMLLRINSLQRELDMAQATAQQKINMLLGSQGTQQRSGKVERVSLEEEMSLLRTEESRLVICSREDAIVGSVNFHVGEKVSPFTPILTLSPQSPTLVKGYIHEKVYNRIAMGDSVVVISANERSGEVRGEVVGVGARIVEFPVRLRKIPELLVWGREVTIRIPGANHFLLGEMVSIRSKSTMGKK